MNTNEVYFQIMAALALVNGKVLIN